MRPLARIRSWRRQLSLRRVAPQVTMDPQRSIAAAEVGSIRGARRRTVRPAGIPDRGTPRRFGTIDADFSVSLRPVPELDVLWLPRGFIVGPSGLALTADGRFVRDVTGQREAPERIRAHHRDGKVRIIRGSIASIATPHAGNNYGHFLLDAIPRLALFEEAGVRLDEMHHLVVNTPGPHGDRLLVELGLRPEQWLRTRPHVAYRADITIVTSMPHWSTSYQSWEVAFLRERLGKPPTRTGRRLWISRRTHRRIINEAELLPILERHGFEAYEPGTTAEDPRQAFAGADIVIGGHGAGLTDLAFCAPGTRVLELMPDSHVRSYFWSLADAAGLDYGYLIGATSSTDAEPNPAKRDYRIDVEVFREAVETIAV